MTSIKFVSDLFKPEPSEWGGRGDPYMWEDMAVTLSDVPLPKTLVQLNELLENTFERLTGVSLGSPGRSVFVKKYSHGGMSSGHVSFTFWRETGIPLLRSRYVGV